ncbi:MAG: hypothetical protein KGY67_09035, partial [Candidatus Thermoplasmatota archaeon]|nr:hypothetical protein [Candidatus Thermoplasmatota archaeon]
WNTQSNIEGFKINNSTGTIQETLYIYIDNSSLYAEQLRAVLLDKLASYQTSTKSMMVFNQTNNTKDASFLGIHVTEESNQYYPWSSACEYHIFYYFSDSGNTNYFMDFKNAESMYDHPAVVFNSSDGEQLLDIGDITIQGSFNGFFSRPRMNKLVIQKIASELINQVNP